MATDGRKKARGARLRLRARGSEDLVVREHGALAVRGVVDRELAVVAEIDAARRSNFPCRADGAHPAATNTQSASAAGPRAGRLRRKRRSSARPRRRPCRRGAPCSHTKERRAPAEDVDVALLILALPKSHHIATQQPRQGSAARTGRRRGCCPAGPAPGCTAAGSRPG
jgi:hypothetical protein